MKINQAYLPLLQWAILFSFFLLPDFASSKQNIETDPFLVSPYYGTEEISQGYSDGHPAYDYTMRFETILVAEDATISVIGWDNNDPNCHQSSTNTACGYGLHIKALHPNNYLTIYGHMSATAVFEVGETISQGGKFLGQVAIMDIQPDLIYISN